MPKHDKKSDLDKYGKTPEVWLECRECGKKDDEYRPHALYGVTDDMQPVFQCGSCGTTTVYVYLRDARTGGGP